MQAEPESEKTASRPTATTVTGTGSTMAYLTSGPTAEVHDSLKYLSASPASSRSVHGKHTARSQGAGSESSYQGVTVLASPSSVPFNHSPQQTRRLYCLW